VELTEDRGPYMKGGRWAEIDERELRRALMMGAEEVTGLEPYAMTPRGRRAQNRVKNMLAADKIGSLLEAAIFEVYQRPLRSDRTRGV
jgi:hypothetical protein